MHARHFLRLLQKDFQLEIRQRSSLAALALYVGCSVFTCYAAVSLRGGAPPAPVWSALFWVIMLFAGMSIVGKSFLGESRGIQLYLHSVAAPGEIVLAKLTYSSLICLVLMLAGMGLFMTLMGNPIQDFGIFVMLLVLGATGFGSTFTLLSAIASRANNSNVLMAVLGFPIIITVVLMCIRATRNCIDGLGWYACQDELLVLLAINAIAVSLSYVLFPYIWRS